MNFRFHKRIGHLGNVHKSSNSARWPLYRGVTAACLIWFGAFSAVTAAELQLVKNDGTIAVKAGDRTVLEYQQTPNPYKVYIRSLTTPSGLQILRDSPHDHVHHHAMMYAIGADGVDFWAENPADKPGKQVPRKTETAIDNSPRGDRRAVINQSISWVDAAERTILEEKRSIVVHQGAVDGATLLTWDSRFSPADGKPTAELWGRHYFGLGVRFVTSMDNVGSFVNSSGQQGESVRGTEQLVRATWCAYTAPVDGKPVTMAMFDHPDNARPATWFTMTKSFAYVAATLNLPNEPMTLAADAPLHLRYGVAVWDGEVSSEVIQQAYQQWISF